MAIEIDLSGRVAFVTGGSRGLGRADALTLARASAQPFGRKISFAITSRWICEVPS